MRNYWVLTMSIFTSFSVFAQDLTEVDWVKTDVDFSKIQTASGVERWKILMSTSEITEDKEGMTVFYPNYYGQVNQATLFAFYESDTLPLPKTHLGEPLGYCETCTDVYWDIVFEKEGKAVQLKSYKEMKALLGNSINHPQKAFLLAIAIPRLNPYFENKTFQYYPSDKGYYLKLEHTDHPLLIIEVTFAGKINYIQQQDHFDERLFTKISQPDFTNIQPALPHLSWKLFGNVKRSEKNVQYFLPFRYDTSLYKSWVQYESNQTIYQTKDYELPLGFSDNMETSGWFILFEIATGFFEEVTTFEEMQYFLGDLETPEEAILLASSYTWNLERRLLGELGTIYVQQKDDEFVLIFDKKTGDCPFRMSMFKLTLSTKGELKDLSILENVIIESGGCARP